MSLLDSNHKAYLFSKDKKTISDDKGLHLGHIKHQKLSSLFSIFDSDNSLVCKVRNERLGQIQYSIEDKNQNLIGTVLRKEPTMIDQKGNTVLKAWVSERGWEVRIFDPNQNRLALGMVPGTFLTKEKDQQFYVLEILNSNYPKDMLLGFFLVLTLKFPIKPFAGKMESGGGGGS